MVWLNVEWPGPRENHADFMQPTGRELLYALITHARDFLFIKPKAAKCCHKTGGGSEKDGGETETSSQHSDNFGEEEGEEIVRSEKRFGVAVLVLTIHITDIKIVALKILKLAPVSIHLDWFEIEFLAMAWKLCSWLSRYPCFLCVLLFPCSWSSAWLLCGYCNLFLRTGTVFSASSENIVLSCWGNWHPARRAHILASAADFF